MLGVAPLSVKTKSGIAACLKQVHRLRLRVLKLGLNDLSGHSLSNIPRLWASS